jgi:hypothetical protein
MPKVPQELKEAHVSREVVFAETPKHPQVRLEQGEQALRPILVHVTTGVLLLCVIDELVDLALQRPIAARGVGIQATPCLDGEGGGFLHRANGEIPDGLQHDGPLAVDPRNDGGPVFVVMTPAGLAPFASTPRSASQGLWPTLFGLALVPSDVIELIGFNRALQLAIGLVGDGSIAQPPAPAIAGADMDAHLPRDAPGGTGEAQQKGREDPVRERSPALGEERVGEVVERAPTSVAPVAFQPRSVRIAAPRIDIVAVTPGTVERAILPPECMDIHVAGSDVEELMEMGEHWHG